MQKTNSNVAIYSDVASPANGLKIKYAITKQFHTIIIILLYMYCRRLSYHIFVTLLIAN